MGSYSLVFAILAIFSSITLAAQPNIVVILTDDQDVLMDSLNYMPGVQANLQAAGTTYNNHFCTVALCCPSRVTIWTGKAAHNTNITDLHPPFGGYPKFCKEGYNKAWLPVWLQQAGYKTYYTGKLMNSHSVHNYNKPPVAGLDGQYFLLEPGTYDYNNPIYQLNTDPPERINNYTTDLLTNQSLAFLEEGVKSGSPFFLTIAPVAPHAATGGPPVPAPEYADAFPDAQIPETANFNPVDPSGASWILNLARLNSTVLSYYEFYYKERLRALQSVDVLVNKTIAALDSYGVLDNTYVVYSSDNGFHIAQHRLSPGKREPYEEDIRVPLIIRGPGIPAGASTDFVSSHMDLSPTILSWAGATSYAPSNLDGQVIPPTQAQATAQNWEHVQVEHWGPASDEGKYHLYPKSVPNTYKALRVVGKNYNLFYSVWCDGSHELYDMTTDLPQMNNLYNSTSDTEILGVPLQQLINRLDALLLVLKTCAAQTCYDPWTALHPEGNVNGLKQALAKKYNPFYRKQPKVNYEACDMGYFIQDEMPIMYNTFSGHGSEFERREFEWWSKYSD